MTETRDHGGGLDAAIATHGGTRANWLDLSTGISPWSWPVPVLPQAVWRTLPQEDGILERAAALGDRRWVP